MPLPLISCLGVLCFIGLAWLCSVDRRRFPWRVVGWGLSLQVLFAWFILKSAWGRTLFDLAQHAVLAVNGFALEGARVVFGPLADEAAMKTAFAGLAPGLFVVVSSTIILVAALCSLLYHWGLLQRLVQGIAWVMRRAMGTSGSETLAAAANIFIGQTEAPLLIKPYIRGMTRSELLALMTTGMATIAGGVLMAYSEIGRQAGFPAMAGHLVAASVMNAPAALMMAKILLPETERSETTAGAAIHMDRSSANSIDAACRGASEGLHLALNVCAMLIAFVALVALANALIGGLTRLAWHPVSLQQIIGWANAPAAWLMGIPAQDTVSIGQILGERIVLNEFFGYVDLAGKRAALQERSFIIATYALCGFANFGSIAIQIGGIGTLVPERRSDLARLGLRAMLAGILACYLTASLVGVLL